MAKCIFTFSLFPDLLLKDGTDLYCQPYGGWVAGWVVATGVYVAAVSPLAVNRLDQAAQRVMRARSSVVTIHLYTFYALAASFRSAAVTVT